MGKFTASFYKFLSGISLLPRNKEEKTSTRADYGQGRFENKQRKSVELESAFEIETYEQNYVCAVGKIINRQQTRRVQRIR